MCKQFVIYLRIKKSVGIFSLGWSLVQSIIRSSRIVHVDVCMTARPEKSKHRDIPRFHSDWAREASLRSLQCSGRRTSRKMWFRNQLAELSSCTRHEKPPMLSLPNLVMVSSLPGVKKENDVTGKNFWCESRAGYHATWKIFGPSTIFFWPK